MNQRLTAYQKYRIFKRLPGAGAGILMAIIGSIVCVPAFASNPSFLFGPAAIILLIWPAIGAYLLIPNVKYISKIISAIEYGECVEATLLEAKNTNTSYGGKPLRKLKFGFQHWGELYTHESKIIGYQPNTKVHYLMVESQKPENAVYLELLPEDIRLELLRSHNLINLDR